MSRLQKKESLKEARRRLIIDTAFRIFVEQKIEPVSMGEIASAAGIGRATLFRYYANKLELVVAVCAAKWKEYLDELAFNSQENVYFGYTLSELNAQFQGEKYIFTLGENNETVAVP